MPLSLRPVALGFQAYVATYQANPLCPCYNHITLIFVYVCNMFVFVRLYFLDDSLAAAAMKGKIIEGDEVEVRPEKISFIMPG